MFISESSISFVFFVCDTIQVSVCDVTLRALCLSSASVSLVTYLPLPRPLRVPLPLPPAPLSLVPSLTLCRVPWSTPVRKVRASFFTVFFPPLPVHLVGPPPRLL